MPNLSGTKWGPSSALGTSGGVVSWSLVSGGMSGVRTAFDPSARGDVTANPGSVVSYSVKKALMEAFAAWSREADIQFVQVKDPGVRLGGSLEADIRIGFGGLDGRGGTLGLAYFPGGARLSGDILFDSLDGSLFSNRGTFMAVAKHEIGHALGLDHVTSTFAIMNPKLGARDLQRDDIAGVRAIYGTGGSSDNALQLSGGRSDLQIVQKLDGLRVEGSNHANIIEGGAGAEVLRGNHGDDRIVAARGKDKVEGGFGDDTLIGGLGNDTVRGDDGEDRVFGGGGADELHGGDDRDMIKGDVGSDRLFGGNGNDTLMGANGRDALNGGDGADILNGGRDRDVLRGGDDSDKLVGGAQNDWLSGDRGDDRLFGGDGGDTLKGGAGNDFLIGEGSADLLFGGGGMDTLSGGPGDDILDGRQGRDRFIFRDADGADTIEGFADGFDIIDVSRSSVNRFSDLTVSQSGGDVRVETDHGFSITIKSLLAPDVSADDFVF